jgi:hypothetical protein
MNKKVLLRHSLKMSVQMYVKVAGQKPVKIPSRNMKVVMSTTRQSPKTYSALVQAVHGDHGSLPQTCISIFTLIILL